MQGLYIILPQNSKLKRPLFQSKLLLSTTTYTHITWTVTTYQSKPGPTSIITHLVTPFLLLQLGFLLLVGLLLLLVLFVVFFWGGEYSPFCRLHADILMMYLWCLCTLYLLACHVSYHWQLRSLLLYLCNIFSELINSLVCWCWLLNYYEIPKLSKPWPKIPWQQAVPICSYPCLSTEPMITATHKAQRNLFYCTFDNKLESTILQAEFTHTNKNTTDAECHLWFITQYMIWQYIYMWV